MAIAIDHAMRQTVYKMNAIAFRDGIRCKYAE